MKKIALLMLVFTLFAGTSMYAQKLKNGTYEGRPMYGDISVRVAISGRKIKEISVYGADRGDGWMKVLIDGSAIKENGDLVYGNGLQSPTDAQEYKENYELLKKEGPRYTSVQEFADAIVTNQSTVIDVMCGATQTCESVIEAVHNALDDKQVYSYSQGRYVTTKNNGDIVRAWEQEGKQKRLATAQRREKLKEEERQRVAQEEAEKKRQEEERRRLAAEKLEQELQNLVTPDASEFKYDVASDGGVKIIKYLGNAMCIKIPEKIEGLAVTEIADGAFDKNTLVKIVLPGTIKAMMSFSGFTELREVILADGMTEIPGTSYYEGVFEGCINLNKVTIGKGIKAISYRCFAGCTNLSEIMIPNSVTSIGESAFRRSGLTSINLPNSIKSIGDYAFYESGLTSINLPNLVTEIGRYAFYKSNLTSIVIPDSITEIERYAFAGCDKLTSIKLPAKLKYIRRGTFSESGLTSIIIPDSVVSIDLYAFYRCKSLTSVTLPVSLNEVGNAAFAKCAVLSEIKIPAGLEKIGFVKAVMYVRDKYGDFGYSAGREGQGNYYYDYNGESAPPTEEKCFVGCSSLPLAMKSKLRELGYGGEF